MSNVISNEEYERELNNRNNILIIEKACCPYKSSISFDDLHRCKLIALWNAMKKWRPGGRKFTSFLYQRVDWECLKTLAEQRKNNRFCIIADIVSDTNESSRNIRDLVDILPTKEFKDIIIQRYIYNMTLLEIGQKHNFSYETARKKIKKAIEYMRNNLSV